MFESSAFSLCGYRCPPEMLEHEPTYSAQKLAATVHVSGKEVAKTVLLGERQMSSYLP